MLLEALLVLDAATKEYERPHPPATHMFFKDEPSY
jgi:hypothetical protein